MRLHEWVATHQETIIREKPRSLRQFYVLAGILPEDGPRLLPREKRDELARLRRLVWRTSKEGVIHIGYAPAEKLLKVLEPLVALLADVKEEAGRQAESAERSRSAID
jgi:hypothetical protein